MRDIVGHERSTLSDAYIGNRTLAIFAIIWTLFGITLGIWLLGYLQAGVRI